MKQEHGPVQCVEVGEALFRKSAGLRRYAGVWSLWPSASVRVDLWRLLWLELWPGPRAASVGCSSPLIIITIMY